MDKNDTPMFVLQSEGTTPKLTKRSKRVGLATSMKVIRCIRSFSASSSSVKMKPCVGGGQSQSALWSASAGGPKASI